MPPTATILSAIAALGAVVALVLLAGRAARWTGLAPRRVDPGRDPARLAVQASLPLDRTRTLHLVRLDGRDLALLTGGPADLALGWLPGPGTAREDAP